MLTEELIKLTLSAIKRKLNFLVNSRFNPDHLLEITCYF